MQRLFIRTHLTRLVACAALLGLCASAQAQLAVQLRSDRDSFLTYESVRIIVSIRNFSGRNIQINEDGGQQWLEMLVTDTTGLRVEPTGKIVGGDSVLVPAGQTLSRVVDLLPLFELRSHGSYRVMATVVTGGQKFVSQELKFAIIDGREIWTQTLGLPAKENDNGVDVYRTYSLLEGKVTRADSLYVSVRDEGKGLVYGMMPLGGYLPVTKPEVAADREGHLHVLFRNNPRSFTYAHVDPFANVVSRAMYSDMLSRPKLMSNPDGTVFVKGGEQTWPRIDRVLTAAELNPPPPPPPAPAKKKHWWSSTPPTPDSSEAKGSSTNAPTSNITAR